MDNLIEYLKELIDKPTILYTVTDKFVIIVLAFAAICIITVAIFAILWIIATIKDHKERKRRK